MRNEDSDFNIVRTLNRVLDDIAQRICISHAFLCQPCITSHIDPVSHASATETPDIDLGLATLYTRSTPIAHLHAEIKALPLKDYLNLSVTQIFPATATPENALHWGLHNPLLGTLRYIHTTPSSRNKALHDMVPSLSLGKSESSRLHE